MPLTTDTDRGTVEEIIEGMGAALREKVEGAVASEPLKAVLIAFVAGIVIGKFVL